MTVDESSTPSSDKHHSETMHVWNEKLKPQVRDWDATVLKKAKKYADDLWGRLNQVPPTTIYVRNIVHRSDKTSPVRIRNQEIASFYGSPTGVRVGDKITFHWTQSGSTPTDPTEINMRATNVTGVAHSQEYVPGSTGGLITLVREIVYVDGTETEFRESEILFPD